MEALCCHPLAKGPSAGAGGGAGAWVWLEAMAAHVGGSHPVAAMVRAASAAAWSAGGAWEWVLSCSRIWWVSSGKWAWRTGRVSAHDDQ